MELVDSPGCERCKQSSEMASRVICDSGAMAVLRFMHLGHHFLKAGALANIYVSKIEHFVKSARLLNVYAKDCAKDQKLSKCKGHCIPHPTVLYCTLTFYCQSCSIHLIPERESNLTPNVHSYPTPHRYVRKYC